MKRFFALLLAATLCIGAFAGCDIEGFRSSKSYTYTVETGDFIEVTLDTSGGYDLSSGVPFSISANSSVQSEGTFIFGEVYEQYVAVVDTDENATLLESSTKDGNEYIFWSYDGETGTEYNYAVKVANSNTALIIANVVSETSARECFGRLTIAVSE